MKKKRYKKIIKKINKLKRLFDANNKKSSVLVWPPVWQPDPGQWEVTYTEPEPYYVKQNN